MDTGRIKRFATEARVSLMEGVVRKLEKLGFNRKGQLTITEDDMPQKRAGGAIFMDSIIEDSHFYDRWHTLHSRIDKKGYKAVVEEAAYTWFNRLMALQILAKNNLCEPWLSFANPNIRVPFIVSEARAARLPLTLTEAERNRLIRMLEDEQDNYSPFNLLICHLCEHNPIISACFGGVDDYTAILLPDDILLADKFLDMLNHTEFITDEDYGKGELIGWLYQFYISEKKDEVFNSFKNKKKAGADEIPAATQIFTPNWIVKYMVQNTVGRIYLDNNPYTDIKDKMQYLVESETGEKFTFMDIKDLTCADLACGSGHILNECFDLLFDIYVEEGYTRKQAIEGIFNHNLLGVDIDTRAKQLATFALLLKACAKDASFADAHCMPRVLDMPAPYKHMDMLRDTLPHFFLGCSAQTRDEVCECFELMQSADVLGSIMKFPISADTRKAIDMRVKEWRKQGDIPPAIAELMPYFDIILALTDKYAALVMNPPYMSSGNMDPLLSKYVKDEYEEGKADLFSTFMILAIDRLKKNGKYGMINMHSWMFLSSFENLRGTILAHQHIDNLLHLGPRTFDELSGEVVQNAAFVITKCKPTSTGTYYRLVDGKNCTDKERMFLEAENINGILYPNISQDNFSEIPGSPIGYWVSEKIRETFTRNLPLSAVCKPTQGLATADNGRFLRSWFEVDINRIGFGHKNAASAADSGRKWFPYNKGGSARKWYGNQELIVNWENDGEEIKKFKGAVIRNPTFYFKESVAWSLTSSVGTAFRYFPNGFIFDVNGMSLFTEDFSILTYLNTSMCTHFLSIINPTLACQIGNVSALPYCEIKNKQYAKNITQQNIAISKQDWDAHETSWDFQRSELLAMDDETYMQNIDWKIDEHFRRTGEHICIDPAAPKFESLEWCVEQYKMKWDRLFQQLHNNEEELNRQFIEIYGLQDELLPYIPKNEVTILQQGEITFLPEPGSEFGYFYHWNDDVIIKQLISYAIGCWMGRYRLDKPGLHIAHPEPTAEEVATYEYNGHTLAIDDDGIIPLLPRECPFPDNAVNRLSEFISIAFGDDAVVDNMNFIYKALNMDVEKYFVKEFWKDHKKMYQNRPIYWLFSSKKGAFKCIVYMHRMDAYTCEKVRQKYLLPYIEWLETNISALATRIAALSTAERKTMERYMKDLEECREYQERLHDVADKQIAFDLDDGVVVNYAKFGDVLEKIK